MLTVRVSFVALLALLFAAPADTLRVLSSTPSGDADPGAVVTVRFDRPVAVALGETVDPKTIFAIAPAVAGRLEWRDPVTIRFTPAAPLAPGVTYTVTLTTAFAALDGSKLEKPYLFSFRVQGPRVMDAWPVNQWSHPKYLTPTPRFTLFVDQPVDLALLNGLLHLRTTGTCGVRDLDVRAVRQRRVLESDPRWGWARRAMRDTLADRRRVVELAPTRPLPLGCSAELGVPGRVDSVAALQWWSFNTYGAFAATDAHCSSGVPNPCPTGPAVVEFSTPVSGAEVMRHVRIVPEVAFTVADTAEESDRWVLEAELKPRTRYLVTVDSTITDVFGQRATGGRFLKSFSTTAFTPIVRYPYGRMVVERTGPRTLAVQHVNVDSLDVIVAQVPESLEAQALARSWGWEDLWSRLLPQATHQMIAVHNVADVPRVTAVRLPASNALIAVKVASPQADTSDRFQPVALLQVTDLAVHARVGMEEATVWVTGVSDGKPRPNAQITLYDGSGRVKGRARTDALGLARLAGFAGDTASSQDGDCEDCEGGFGGGFEGYVAAALGSDRAVVGISQYDPDLSPWQFNVMPAWGDERRPGAAAVFVERGIYRPGEPVYAKAIVRRGPLGSLFVPRGDSLRWLFKDREQGVLKDTTAALSAFGTADARLDLAPDLPLGQYRVEVEAKRDGRWRLIASTYYRVAEYRPPEFLVTATTDTAPRFAGDSFPVTVEARYLFGAPMGRARVSWLVRRRAASGWEYDIPNTDGYDVGERGWWWEDDDRSTPEVMESGEDTLDAAGHLRLRLAAGAPAKGRAAWTTLEATVTDVNRQTSASAATVLVHPASFYIGAKVDGNDYFWTAGKARRISVIAVAPDGRRVPGVAIAGVLVRREWHTARRSRAGFSEEIGAWVSDTVGRCDVTSAADPVACTVTPPAGGSYTMRFTAADAQGRAAVTSFYRWATGPGWVPWNDESKFKMDVIPDKTRYVVGDTATVLFATPFTNAEAWVTVEREGIIEQRRLRITAGSTTLRFPITEAYAPNAFVSILVARGRSAPPAAPDDPGRPTLRVGYAELRVTPEVKRLGVEVQTGEPEYRPGDSARVQLRVRDARGAGRRAEVALWAVDEGVLALTGYKTPDPIDLIYRERGLGLRLASTLVSVAAQVVEGEKGQRAPGGGGGMETEGILRSRFQTTAFFLGSVVTDSAGRATATAKLPDNLTTFRVMAVAVTAGDRYGSGQSSLLVTRPLLARPALPRFVRDGDRYSAGVVVNQRLGGTPEVRVQVQARGVEVLADSIKTARLEAGRGREVRFGFHGIAGDSAVYRFKVTSGNEADAVETRVPIRPAFHPRAFTVSGTLADTATADFSFPEPLDPDRSRLVLSFGTSPLALVRGYNDWLKVYPYYCSEQISSVALPLIALLQAQKQWGGPPLVPANSAAEIAEAVAILSRRQRDDGAIGYWSNRDWSSPWLTAYAGRVLLAARSAGAAVSDTVLSRVADYLTRFVHADQRLAIPVAYWYADSSVWRSEKVAAVDFLSRMGRPDIAAENALLAVSRALSWEDRVLLAEVVARRRQLDAARAILEPTWRDIRVEGRRAVLPEESNRKFYFYSNVRAVARILTATLAVDPHHRLIGPLVETLIQRGRAETDYWWNTQDYGAAVPALLAYEWQRQASANRPLRVTQGGRTLLEARGAMIADTSIPLTGLLTTDRAGKQSLRVALGSPAAGAPVYFILTVREVPQQRPVTPFEQGIRVERWYERYDTAAPVVRVAEGDLVRVRLRITVPTRRHFVVIDDALPAGLEAVDVSLRTMGTLPPTAAAERPEGETEQIEDSRGWYYGVWEYGWWSPFDHRELRDDRVVYTATTLWPGVYTATYVARATTPGVFVRPPVHAEEMYNPAVNGRSDGGIFTVTPRTP